MEEGSNGTNMQKEHGEIGYPIAKNHKGKGQGQTSKTNLRAENFHHYKLLNKD